MFVPGLAFALPALSTAPLLSFTDWLTVTLALTWTFAGLILLFFGWILLPRGLDECAGAQPSTKTTTSLRAGPGNHPGRTVEPNLK
ncbi:MAG TPA: hypothetical protein VMG81_03985 [Thermoplasmata archaeon]|nr:hypothetical protein [Thermoplasmata archaeon]